MNGLRNLGDGTCSDLATDLIPPTSQAVIALAVRNCDDSDGLSF